MKHSNVQKIDKLQSNLMSLLLPVTFTGVYKHTTLLQNLYIINKYCFKVQPPKPIQEPLSVLLIIGTSARRY
jgi:hypothetical protein